MNEYGITPAQYHAGLDKLWAALGLTGPQDRDVFTLAAERIRQLEAGVYVVVDGDKLGCNEAFHNRIAADRQAAAGGTVLRLYGNPRQAKFLRPAGHKCSISTGIHDCFTFGTGKLSDNGFWSEPCYECARAHEEQFPDSGSCWPHSEEQLAQLRDA
jgi:hypothetical protein